MLLIALSVCIDNFALSMAYNLAAGSAKKAILVQILIIFPLVQMGLAFVGWLAGTELGKFIDTFDHWIAFGLLAFIGIKLVLDAAKEFREKKGRQKSEDILFLTWLAMFIVALATSTDALAVGFTYALIDVNITSAIQQIGLATAIISIIGFYAGEKLGKKFENRLKLLAGIVLFGLGLKILIDHLLG